APLTGKETPVRRGITQLAVVGLPQVVLVLLENVHYEGEEHPDTFLARVDGMLNTLSNAGVRKSDEEVSRIIVRQLPDKLFSIEKRSRLTDPNLSRSQIEGIIRSAYARQRAEQLRRPSASAPAASTSAVPSPASAAQRYSHALSVGTADGFRQRGQGGFGRHPGGSGGGMGTGGMARGLPPGPDQQWRRGDGAQLQQRYGLSQSQQWSQGGSYPQQRQSRGRG
ncbi:unnamed protein product, partial [Scytosiphon promiscuus]